MTICVLRIFVKLKNSQLKACCRCGTPHPLVGDTAAEESGFSAAHSSGRTAGKLCGHGYWLCSHLRVTQGHLGWLCPGLWATVFDLSVPQLGDILQVGAALVAPPAPSAMALLSDSSPGLTLSFSLGWTRVLGSSCFIPKAIPSVLMAELARTQALLAGASLVHHGSAHPACDISHRFWWQNSWPVPSECCQTG